MEKQRRSRFVKNMLKYMPGPESKYRERNKPAGLAVGFVHGFLLPLTFIFSQFEPNLQLYETYNIARQYNLGFVIGIIVLIRAIIH